MGRTCSGSSIVSEIPKRYPLYTMSLHRLVMAMGFARSFDPFIFHQHYDLMIVIPM